MLNSVAGGGPGPRMVLDVVKEVGDDDAEDDCRVPSNAVVVSESYG